MSRQLPETAGHQLQQDEDNLRLLDQRIEQAVR